jgi:hypothetical protein
VDARIAPDRPQDAVLDVVQADRFALDAQQLGVPRAVAEQAWRDVDVANARDWIVVEHNLNRQRVVQVDPEGELLRPGVAADRHGGEVVEVGGERRPVRRADAAVGEACDAVRARYPVRLQQALPCRMIEGGGRGLVVRRPARPRLGSRCEQRLERRGGQGGARRDEDEQRQGGAPHPPRVHAHRPGIPPSP